MAEDAGAERTARRDRLAARRRAMGLTQEDLAALLEIERSTVARWERGKTQPLPWIRPRLARALQVPVSRLAELLAAPALDRRGSPVPRQLPAAVADFTGRTAELQSLTRLLEDVGAGAAGTLVISAIGGTAGVGKTALAVHWAHQVADRFPDGQLHVNLRGFDPSAAPAAPTEAIRGFLDALGVPPERIPPQPDAQTGLYRSLLADRKTLIMLDNARDEQQVRPLLPASPASLVLVTSRNQLAGLATDGARLLSLDVLTHAEAVELLTARLGRPRTAAEPAAADEVATLCACLPLALAVAAARAAARPTFPLAALAAELRDTAGRLDALDGGDPAASVRAVFSWSYQQLSPEAARMFRLLGLHPGPDISVPAAASLAGIGEPESRRLLGDLARACLITEHVPGRYGFHDLLRTYAAGQARACDSEPEHTAAVGRVFDHYLHTAALGAFMLNSTQEQVTLPPPGPGTVPERPASHRSALAWFDAEYPVLLAAIDLAAESGFDRYAWQLPWAMKLYLQARGHYQQWAATHRTGLAAATRLGDINGQAVSGRMLAAALTFLGDYDQARSRLGHCLGLYQRLGDRLGEAKVHHNLGLLAARQRRYAAALRHTEDALRLYQDIGDKAAQTDALSDIGWCHDMLGDYEQARTVCRRALLLNAEVADRRLEGSSWDNLGYAEHHLGNFGEATACYERALAVCREFGERYAEATVLTHLGDACHAAGDLPRARQAWQHALTILEDLENPDADQVRAKLDGADETAG